MRQRNKTVLTYRCYPPPTGAWLISHFSRTFVALTQFQNCIFMAAKLLSDVKDANAGGQLQKNLNWFIFAMSWHPVNE